jgi:16S rRNA (cytosine967-C5)-methyltransferase
VALPSARRAALAALRQWQTKKQFADSVLSSVLSVQELGASDRAFVQELFYGVLRYVTLLDFWIGRLRSSRLTADLRDILRLGLYQLLLLNLPGHAAVYESVELAPARNRGLVNAILRSASRQRESLRAAASRQPLAVRTSHPEFLVDRWQNSFGSDATAELCGWNNEPPHVYARINHLKIDDREFGRTYPDARSVPGKPSFVEFSTSFPHEALASGYCYIQDPSTALSCELLDPQPGERILDACAAPGGKTGLLAAMMQNRGTIEACDRDPRRLQVLQENLIRLGVEISRPFCHDWKSDRDSLALKSAGLFDRILVDVPCTNTGVMRRRADVRWRLQPGDFCRMQEQQLCILNAVAPLLRPQGVLVYSTCSLEPEENEHVVKQLLASAPNSWRQEAIQISLPFRDGQDGAYAARLIRS